MTIPAQPAATAATTTTVALINQMTTRQVEVSEFCRLCNRFIAVGAEGLPKHIFYQHPGRYHHNNPRVHYCSEHKMGWYSNPEYIVHTVRKCTPMKEKSSYIFLSSANTSASSVIQKMMYSNTPESRPQDAQHSWHIDSKRRRSMSLSVLLYILLKQWPIIALSNST